MGKAASVAAVKLRCREKMAVGRFDRRSELDLQYTFPTMSDRWFAVGVVGLGVASIALFVITLFWF
jgi:hypothetical protein